MSCEKLKLNDISDILDQNISKIKVNNECTNLKKGNYRYFISKNNRPASERDQEVVTSYKTIIHGIRKAVGSAVSIFSGNTKVPTTSLGIKPIKNVNDDMFPKYIKSNSQPLRPNFQLSNTTAINGSVSRCKKCTCALTVSSGGICKYCNDQEIEVIDSDCEEFPSIEHCIKPTSSKMPNNQISTSSFYSKENSSIENSTPKANISMTEDDLEKGVKYEIDYLYIGTYRFISRTYIRVSSENISLFINSSRDGLNIDYKLIMNVVMCEPRNQSPRHIYMQIEFNREAVEAINQYVSKTNVEGHFKFESINGHEKYFLMKLKHLSEDDSSKLRMRLGIQLPRKCKEDARVFQLFEEQRHYNLNLRARKKQKTNDSRIGIKNQCRTKTNEIKTEVQNFKDESMEVDQFFYSNIPNITTSSLNQEQLLSNTDKSTKASCERTPFQKRKQSSIFNSNESFKSAEDDMEISEIAKPKFNLSIESIKNNKILFKTIFNEVLIILKTDLYCLNDGNFLNDKIIEFYLMYIKSKLIDNSIAEKTYIFNSFFFTKMISLTKGSSSEEQFNENLYNLVKKWTKSIDVFNYDYLIVPVFRNYHWSLAIICYPGKLLKDDFEVILDCEDNKKPAIIFMDSMGRNRMFYKYSKYLRNFLQKECLHKKNKSIAFGNQEMTNLDAEVPCQLNGYDCGIFVLHYVELFLKNPQYVIQKIRKNKLSLIDWFSPNELKEKRKDIYTILYNIYEDNVKNNLKFEMDEDLTINKSDEEIEILTNENVDKDLSSDDDSML